MNIRSLGRGLLVVAVLIVIWLGWRLTHLWSYQQVGPYTVRQNALTGKIQVQDSGTSNDWVDALGHDAYAPPVAGDTLKSLQLIQGVWGPKGILCGRVVNHSTSQDVKGRLGLLINVYSFDGKRTEDRTLRAAVDWPAGKTTPFVLDTQLTSPVAKQRWTVDLVPIQDAGGQ